MDLTKFEACFKEVGYDSQSAMKSQITNTQSTIIISQSSDLESATDFISNTFQSEDLYQIRTILVQASVEEKLIALLKQKLKNVKSFDDEKLKRIELELKSLENNGFEVVRGGSNCGIVKCPRDLIAINDLPLINFEVFRTTKEGISFAKSAKSIGLWCESLSIAFEFINGMKNARQIWLNSTHGSTHPKIPFYNATGQIFCEDSSNIANKVEGSLIEVKGNIQFQTTFHGENSSQTIVIPFGESFAN